MASMSKLNVVVDTNVWISGLVFGGNPQKVIKAFVEGQVLVSISEEILSELRRKILERFPLFQPNLALLESSIREDAILVPLGATRIQASRDANDDVFIETALASGAEYIITGDNDLLVLGSYEEIKIIKPADFILLIES